MFADAKLEDKGELPMCRTANTLLPARHRTGRLGSGFNTVGTIKKILFCRNGAQVRKSLSKIEQECGGNSIRTL